MVANAGALADGLLARGLALVTGGTDNHLLVLDVSPCGVTGRQAESALRDAAVMANRNAIPGDRNGPWYTSGLRLGTPAARAAAATACPTRWPAACAPTWPAYWLATPPIPAST